MILIERVKELSNYGEIITGSENERKIINKIKKYFDIKKIDCNIHPIRVYSWNVKDLEIDCNGKKINDNDLLLPYSSSHDLETEEYCIIEFNDIYEIPYLYNFNKKKCNIIIFTKDDIKRKNIVVYGNELSRNPSHPPPIPAYYLPKNLIKIIQGKCRFYAEVNLNPNAIGYILEAIVPAHSENVISVSAHHDNWFEGEHSSKIGVAALTLLDFKSNYHEVRIYSFTATETGNVGFPTIYWGYGSYTYLNQIKHRDKILLNININNIYSKFHIVAPSGLCENFSNLPIECKKGIYYQSDSLNFIKKGIPSIDLVGSNELEKTSADKIKESENYDELLAILNHLITYTREIKVNSKEVMQDLKYAQQKLPLRIKSYINNFYDILNNMNIYRKLLENFGIILYSKDKIDMQVVLFHKLLGLSEILKGNKVMIEDLKLLEDECRDPYCERFYTIYINELLRRVEDEYLDRILLSLKEFF